MLADELQKLLDNFYSNYPEKVREPRGTLLILDRSFDIISPVVHDFYYQSNASEYRGGFKGDDGEFKLDNKTIYLND
jgi:hypothetical protein